MRDILELTSIAKDLLRKVAGSRPLLAFSGGKDSIVTCHIAAQIGIRVAVCEESFCYPQQMVSNRLYANKLGLYVSHENSLDLDWLRRHREIIFTSDTKVRAWSFHARQQTTVRRHAKLMRATCTIFGRRTEENSVKAGTYTTSDGALQCHPLRDWTTEEVWEYMSYFKLGKPWFYNTEMAEHAGSGPFYSIKASDFGGEAKCWKLVAKHEPAFNRSILKSDTAFFSSPYRFSGVKS